MKKVTSYHKHRQIKHAKNSNKKRLKRRFAAMKDNNASLKARAESLSGKLAG